MGDVCLEPGVPVIELISLGILSPDFARQLLRLFGAVFLQLLLVFLQLNQLVVEHLDFGFLSLKHVCMVPL